MDQELMKRILDDNNNGNNGWSHNKDTLFAYLDHAQERLDKKRQESIAVWDRLVDKGANSIPNLDLVEDIKRVNVLSIEIGFTTGLLSILAIARKELENPNQHPVITAVLATQVADENKKQAIDIQTELNSISFASKHEPLGLDEAAYMLRLQGKLGMALGVLQGGYRIGSAIYRTAFSEDIVKSLGPIESFLDLKAPVVIAKSQEEFDELAQQKNIIVN